MDYYSVNDTELKVKMIEELFRLTKAGKTIWKKDELDVFRTEYKALITFTNYKTLHIPKVK